MNWIVGEQVDLVKWSRTTSSSLSILGWEVTVTCWEAPAAWYTMVE